MKIRVMSVVVAAAMVMLVVGCTPASGLPDARVITLNACQQLEVRVQPGADQGVSVAVRLIGFIPQVASSNPGTCGFGRVLLGFGDCGSTPGGQLYPPCSSYQTFPCLSFESGSPSLFCTWYVTGTSGSTPVYVRVGWPPLDYYRSCRVYPEALPGDPDYNC